MYLIQDFKQYISMLPQPAFAVEKGEIICCNQLAEKIPILPGTKIDDLLITGREEYARLSSEQLYLSLSINDISWDAQVCKLQERDIFSLEPSGVTQELKGMSLVCGQLRRKFFDLELVLDRMTSPLSATDRANVQLELNRITRIFNNVSNAENFALLGECHVLDRNVCDVVAEFVEECTVLLAKTGIRVHYTAPEKDIISAADWHMFQQAFYNLVDNAAQHLINGGDIWVELTRRGKYLQLSITDNGSGIHNDAMNNIFTRYSRDPAFETGVGVGLGLLIARTVARTHGGAILIESKENKGTRVTMTFALRLSNRTRLSSSCVCSIPSMDDALIMLSDVLPAEVYRKD